MNKTRVDYQVLPIPPIPNTQARSSATFKPPPLDGSLNLPEVCEWNARHNPEHPLFVYADDDGKEHEILWPAFVRGVRRVCSLIQHEILSSENGHRVESHTIGVIASSDSITYFTTIFGILASGNVVFPISTRNSPAAIAHLLKEAGVDFLLIGRDDAQKTLATASLELMETSEPKTIPMFAFGDIYYGDSDGFITTPPVIRPSMESTAIILHSSGTASFPKPIRWSHCGLIQQAIVPYFGEIDLTGLRMACHAIPVFHAMGVLHACFAAGTGLVVAVFEPQSPPIQPTPDSFMKGIRDTKSDFVLTVPSFIEIWGRNDDYVEHLKQIRGVLSGGGPLEKASGDSLRDKGVRIYIAYGCTEGVVCCQYLWETPCENWEYFPLPKAMDVKLVPQDDGRYELVLKPGPFSVPFVFNTMIDGECAYATGDLLVPHPSKPGFYNIYGRADDQIMHSSGEKTNPVPLENIVIQDPSVQAVVMFGRGRFNAGILIEPVSSETFDPGDDYALAAFRDRIWPTMEKMNDYAPQHSRIFKEMILVAKQSKPFTFTAKGSVRRQATVKDYAEEIDELYATVDGTIQRDTAIPAIWTAEESTSFVRNVVRSVLKSALSDRDDFFLHGCDSLQATWIRNTLLNALRSTPGIDVRKLPVNFVYSNPSVSALANYLSQIAGPDGDLSAAKSTASKVENMLAMVAKYTDDFPTHVPFNASASSLNKSGAVVLLTGTTGGLGSALLWKLLEDKQVSKVYAFNRRGSGDLCERQSAAFRIRGLDSGLLSSSKLVMLEVDLESKSLGLEEYVYAEIRDSVTHIIHNAYTVNFNLSLSSFEPNVLSLRQLIDLALSSPRRSPPRLMFTSSIGTIRNYEGEGCVPEASISPESAVGSGYGESKWVCEAILSIAAAKSALRPITIRVGQLSGISTNGYWNPKEWVPSLFKSSMRLGCLPHLNSNISWIPVDVAAQVLLDMLDSETSGSVMHLVHSHPVTWSSLFEPAGRLLRLRLVSYQDWLEALEGSVADLSSESAMEVEEDNPALTLIDFFRSSQVKPTRSDTVISGEHDQHATEAMGLKQPSLEKALESSASLRGCSSLCVDDLLKWLKCWNLVD